MELQTPFTKENELSDKLFRRLFQIQIELERFSKNQPRHAESVANVALAIDQLFESVMNDESWIAT